MPDSSVTLTVYGTAHTLSRSKVRPVLRSELQRRARAAPSFPRSWRLVAQGEDPEVAFLLYSPESRVFSTATTAWRLVRWVRDVPIAAFSSPPQSRVA